MIYTPKTKKAMVIAYEAHKNQVDKGGVPYIYHPMYLASRMQDEKTTCVALLHDVLEDTEVTLEYLRAQGFDEDILAALQIMTHEESVPYMDYIRSIRKNKIATVVKLADLEHNSDLSRLNEVTEQALQQAEKYKRAIEALRELPDEPPVSG
ncbi:MAG: GTP pyrophosphokinase [Roseburia sp.]|nr:GTP pyrophosphokinase [Roseburia sp.]MCM1096664.1 GTP pyrophosphokinase [Ruminococcus flavefaciens]